MRLRAILLLAVITGISAVAQARSWSISHFDDTIVISKDSSAFVSERIDLVFVGEWHGIYRDIPVEYPGPHGTNYTLLMKVDSVTDDRGNKLKYEDRTSGGFRHLKIFIPDAVDTNKTVELSYTVRNGVRNFEDYEEFYWNVTGNDWPVPIDSASARVLFPENASGLRAQAFTGVYGSTEHEATASIEGNKGYFI